MTDIEVESPELLVHEITDEVDKGPQTLAEQLKQKRQQIAETHDAFFPLTGYEEYGVNVKHRLMDRTEIEQIARRIMNETRDRGERNMRILLDLIANSTLGFFLKDEDDPDGDPRPIIDDLRGDTPVMNWGMFAQYLGWNPNGDDDTSRGAMYFVFGNNEFMIGQYGVLLNRWMNNTGLKVDEEFLGEAL
jgi:hypothetical protein